jgi:hypothetical protein
MDVKAPAGRYIGNRGHPPTDQRQPLLLQPQRGDICVAPLGLQEEVSTFTPG